MLISEGGVRCAPQEATPDGCPLAVTPDTLTRLHLLLPAAATALRALQDDDGERMIACDVCGVWSHTRCNDIADELDEPPAFVCRECAASKPVAGGGGGGKGAKGLKSIKAPK